MVCYANPLGVLFWLPALKCENKGEVNFKNIFLNLQSKFFTGDNLITGDHCDHNWLRTRWFQSRVTQYKCNKMQYNAIKCSTKSVLNNLNWAIKMLRIGFNYLTDCQDNFYIDFSKSEQLNKINYDRNVQSNKVL